MRHGSLFSGIGGFDLAAEWMGWENVFHCEINPFGQKILKHYWPNSISYEDIAKTDFTIHARDIDIISGGFPCQPFSLSGKRRGVEDERHLWPSMLRAIREIQPRWVVGENVFGLINWNGGMVFDEVQSDLEAEGYEVWSYVLPAVSKNAPHRRDRLWIIAHAVNHRYSDGRRTSEKEDGISGICGQAMESGEFDGAGVSWNDSDTDGNGFNRCDSKHEINASEGGVNALGNVESGDADGDIANSKRVRFQERSETSNLRGEETASPREGGKPPIPTQTTSSGYWGENAPNSDGSGRRESAMQSELWASESVQSSNDSRSSDSSENGKGQEGGGWVEWRETYWQNFPTQSPICSGDDGLSTHLDNITFSKWRNESIKGYGNAVVPQVVYEIFKAIQQYENQQP